MKFIDELFAATGYTSAVPNSTGIANHILQTAAKNYILSNLEEVTDKLRDRLRTHRADLSELDLAKCIVQTAYVKSVQYDALLEFYNLALNNTNQLPNTHSTGYVEDMMKFFAGGNGPDFKNYMVVAFAPNSSIQPDKSHTRYLVKKLIPREVPISKEVAELFLLDIKELDIKDDSNYNVTFRMLDYLNKFTPKAGEIYERKFNEFWAHRSKPKLDIWGNPIGYGNYNNSRYSSKVSERAAIMKSIFTCTDVDLRYKIARNFLLKTDDVLKKRLLKMVPEFQKLLNLK
jgi:hypothetical protein